MNNVGLNFTKIFLHGRLPDKSVGQTRVNPMLWMYFRLLLSSDFYNWFINYAKYSNSKLLLVIDLGQMIEEWSFS